MAVDKHIGSCLDVSSAILPIWKGVKRRSWCLLSVLGWCNVSQSDRFSAHAHPSAPSLSPPSQSKQGAQFYQGNEIVQKQNLVSIHRGRSRNWRQTHSAATEAGGQWKQPHWSMFATYTTQKNTHLLCVHREYTAACLQFGGSSLHVHHRRRLCCFCGILRGGGS